MSIFMVKSHDALPIVNQWFTIAIALWVKMPFHTAGHGFTLIKVSRSEVICS